MKAKSDESHTFYDVLSDLWIHFEGMLICQERVAGLQACKASLLNLVTRAQILLQPRTNRFLWFCRFSSQIQHFQALLFGIRVWFIDRGPKNMSVVWSKKVGCISLKEKCADQDMCFYIRLSCETLLFKTNDLSWPSAYQSNVRLHQCLSHPAHRRSPPTVARWRIRWWTLSTGRWRCTTWSRGSPLSSSSLPCHHSTKVQTSPRPRKALKVDQKRLLEFWTRRVWPARDPALRRWWFTWGSKLFSEPESKETISSGNHQKRNPESLKDTKY